MLVEGKLLRIGAVIRTPAPNTTIAFEGLIGVNSVLATEVKAEMLSGEQGWWGKQLVRVHPDASLPAITAALQQAVDRSPALQKMPPEMLAKLGKRKVMDIALSPLRRAYFDLEVADNYITSAGDRANPVIVAGLGAMAVLILALAAINYVNLAAVRVLRRQREVAMRKVLGARVRDIVLQQLAESMLVSMLATGLGLLLAWAALPLFSELVNRKLDTMLSAGNLVASLVVGLLLGALTAVYPAWIAIRVRPNQALAGRSETESAAGMRLRRVLTVVQVSTAMGIASIALAVTWQTTYAMRASPGFDPAPLLIVDLPEQVRAPAQERGLVTALAAQPGVVGVAISEDAVGRRKFTSTRNLKREGSAGMRMEVRSVSTNFFELYGVKPAAGRLFSRQLDKEDDEVPTVINAIAAKQLGFVSAEAALGQLLQFQTMNGKVISKRIVGIAPELRLLSMREAPGPVAYELWSGGTTLTVRAPGALVQLEATLQSLWPAYFPESRLEMHRAGDILAANYADDARLAKLLAIATGIALAIAAFGTYVLSAHTVQRRAKEIVMRKLHGARRRHIGMLVVREISNLTLIASAVALPLAAVAIQRYLSTYVEHAPIGYWTLLFALASTFAISLVAVARHAWIAMRMMPAEALRL